ncbi:CbtB domain-containing protein [Halomonas huangheensis]|uniref:CbtB domain-containing protein n=1 Tax=Halomonas huangheensis TaxID=1178482 RepID=UPI0009DBEE88|nr:CbtB domain-containing protein [Halomonas huangheensis]
MSSISTLSSQRSARSHSRLTALQQGAVVLFGALILYAVGFLPMNVAHNAAHDTRHVFVFPCH